MATSCASCDAAGARRPRSARCRLTLGRQSRAAAARRATPCARRVRAAAVGQVGRPGDPGAARVAGTGGRLVDQDRPARRDPASPRRSSGRCSCSIRSRLSGERSHTWSPLRAARDLGRRARGRLATGVGRRARSARRRGRRLLGDRRRAAARAAAVHRGGEPEPGSTASSGGRTARADASLTTTLTRLAGDAARRARARGRPRRV